MVTAYDVPGEALVPELAKELRKFEEIKPPEWAKFVKTSPANERPPDEPADVWWYTRAASILRQVYLHGPVGVERLRTRYGGRYKRRHGYNPEHFRKGSGKIIRTILQQLEKAGLVKKVNEGKRKGRVVTPKGQALVDSVAWRVYQKLYPEKKVPGQIILSKYYK